MDTNLIRPFVVLLCAFFAVQNTSAQNPDNGVLATPLEQYRHNYQQFSLTDYYAGGEKSRFAWQSLPGLFRHATISHTQVKPIDYAPDNGFANRAIRVNKESMSFDGYVKGDERIDSIMVLHHGKLVYQYFKHHRPHDRHIMWSVTKVITAAALAILESKGLVDMQAQVKQYIPELNRSGWSDIKVQDVVDMASGIDCNDSDTRPDSCYSRIDVSFDLAPAAKGQESTMDIFNQMTKQRAPG